MLSKVEKSIHTEQPMTVTVGYSISRLAAFYNDIEFNLVYLPNIKGEYWIIAAFLLLTLIIYLLLYRHISIK